MTISNTRFRQILREEAANSSTARAKNSFKFSKSEVLALQEIRHMSINENDSEFATQVVRVVLKSSVGRKILIEILEVVKFITGLEGIYLSKIGVPVINKAIAFVEKHSSVNMPFSGEDLLEFFQNFMPSYWITLGIGKLIELLEDTSDQEFKRVIIDIDSNYSASNLKYDLDSAEERFNESTIRSHVKSHNRKLQIIMGR